MSLKIDDPLTQAMLMMEIVFKWHQGSQEYCAEMLSAGLSKNIIDEISKMTTAEVCQLVANHPVDISFNISESSFQHARNSMRKVNEDYKNLFYLIENNATKTLIKQITTIDSEKIDECFRVYGKQQRAGRPTMPSNIAIRDQIHVKWHAIQKELNEKYQNDPPRHAICHNLIQLHRDFPDISIDSLYAAVNEFRHTKED